ncbi:hypothetical protein LTR56_019497 [Elasticomyces elasticus]|nr:hypothetical protein LTR56_019497 [Elasticomyces elasticus]KAK3654335.1 hypothetical protein LTR22_010811 [Elasticomyces elasticus]KAK4920267.1 hypothetical protein LTR49_012218 [Elasticomyces elasticus]KAK5750780.1 hypothetical protein LTS12_019146 [Elasticomyces elasticus]
MAVRDLGGLITRFIPYNLGLWRQTTSPARPLIRRYSSQSNDATQTCQLPNGRTLAYTTYGSPTGHPIFELHGFPGSRLEAAIYHEPALELGANVIGVDRPGIGFSTPHLGRTVLEHAEDLRFLAKALGHSSYSIIGVSGGGPYALACAYLHSPEVLKKVVLVAGMGPHDVSVKGMRIGNRFIFWCFQYFPWLARLTARLSATQYNRLIAMPDDQLSAYIAKTLKSRLRFRSVQEKDAEAMSDITSLRMMLISGSEHFRQGTDAWLEEGKLVTSPIGFDLNDVKVPVLLWCGKQDLNVPLSIGEEIAKGLPEELAKLRIEDETHISLVLNQRRDVLKEILNGL